MNVLVAGQKIADRYQLDRRIAVGGMGEVWEASDTRLGRSVAVKVLRPELSDDPEFLHRFRIEARTVASLDHTGIAAVHDYGEDEGPAGRRTAYLVMELVRGEPLSTLISHGPIDADETLRLIEEAAWALQAAHERWFVHRDVKPGNILVRTDGLVKLTDFGIAKAADAVPVTRSGMVMGTAHYIAPEQASGAEAGPSGDVYSLGIVGYECLAGHRPFRAESAVAVAMMQVRDEPPPLPESVPAGARELIESVLVKDPTQRYSTGGEFALAIAAVRRGEPVPPPASLSGETPVIPARPPATPTRPVVSLNTPPRSPTGQSEITRSGTLRSGSMSSAPLQSAPFRSAPLPSGPVPSGPVHSGPVQSGPVHSPFGASGPVQSPRGLRAPAAGPSAPGRPRPQPAPRRPPDRVARQLPTEPLRLQPKASSRTLLLVLFVLLTLAAVAVGIVVYGGLRADGGLPDTTPQSAGTGTVTGWEGGLAGPAVVAGPFVPEIVTESVR